MKLQNRPQPEGLLKERSTIQSYWHHFDDDEEAWPKVVLLMSSTKRTTTRRKYSKKTFATYFPHLNQKYTTTEHTNSKNDKYEGYNVKVTLKTKNFATNTISLNTDRISDVVIHLRLENDTETKEAKDVEAERRTDVNTTTWKNSSNIEKKINDEEAKAKLKKEEKVVKPNLSLEEVSEQAEEEKPKLKEEPVTNQYLVPKMEPKVDADEKGKNKTTRRADIRCYQCGLKSPKVPNAPTCRQAFAGDERKYFFLKPRYKVKCGKTYKDGCFTRYLDIGATYDERGCRTMPPLEGRSFASRRMARLEKALHNLREGCITSPHASLTPFSRSISLFTRRARFSRIDQLSLPLVEHQFNSRTGSFSLVRSSGIRATIVLGKKF
ncbi:hypothetical protein PYW08_000613 [Mythimna loreyi]|uniref:Uncharacterized protein n=1 Tax=Mythimna loreyi TaxID=667449 RepID=A0ACC2RCX4_9NEOP|nr:hypothetical protein PYW08_000613 [Mythimna loreyi]